MKALGLSVLCEIPLCVCIDMGGTQTYKMGCSVFGLREVSRSKIESDWTREMFKGSSFVLTLFSHYADVSTTEGKLQQWRSKMQHLGCYQKTGFTLLLVPAEIKVSSAESPEIPKVVFLNAWSRSEYSLTCFDYLLTPGVGQNIALRASIVSPNA